MPHTNNFSEKSGCTCKPESGVIAEGPGGMAECSVVGEKRKCLCAEGNDL